MKVVRGDLWYSITCVYVSEKLSIGGTTYEVFEGVTTL